MTSERICSPGDRWRPADRSGPVCGYTFRGESCSRRGAHFCEQRADRVVRFFAELLVHPTGPHKRRPFVLADWQERGIVRPLFGEVIWTSEWGGMYVRRYRIGYVCMARKQGKTALAAGIVLYLMVGDDEEGAEVYGAAKDTKQAGKVFQPALRMMQLSPVLSARLTHAKNARRLIDERTSSYYEVITSDALGELGHNPHGFVLDEVLSQRDGSLWEAMTSARGARAQPLMLAITTETNDPHSFGAELIDEAERVQDDPSRAAHAFSFVRKTPIDADPWDEANWAHANPALGDFLSVEALREDAVEARNQPAKENGFRQYRLNQRQQQTTRWMPLHLWDGCVGEAAPNPGWLEGRAVGVCYGGLDLSSKQDLTALCWLFPEADGLALWRFWLPEDAVAELDRHTGGQVSVWVREGWITATDGSSIDYDLIYDTVEVDAGRFKVAELRYDVWSGEPVRQAIVARTGVDMVPMQQGFRDYTLPMSTLMTRVLAGGGLVHGGNPVARWHADSSEAKSAKDNPDLVRLVKPVRHASGKRVDGMAALLMAVAGEVLAGERLQRSVYEDRGLDIA